MTKHDDAVLQAIERVLQDDSQANVLDLLREGFYTPTEDESLRFIVYGIFVLQKRQIKVDEGAILAYLGRETIGVLTGCKAVLKGLRK